MIAFMVDIDIKETEGERWGRKTETVTLIDSQRQRKRERAGNQVSGKNR